MKAEKILQTKVWDDSLTYSTAPSAKVAGTDSSGQSLDVEMTDAASEVTPPTQVVAPSAAKSPKVPPTRPVSPPKASPAKAKGPIDIRSVPKAPVPTVPAKGGTPARSPDPGCPSRLGSGGSSPADPPKAPVGGAHCPSLC